MKKSMLVKVAGLVMVLGLVSGCATTEQIKQLQADVSSAQAAADNALSTANAAKSDAAAASRKADDAMAAANAAKRAADECNEKCSRIMQKAMAK